MAYRHGVYIQETPTQLTPPVQVDSALPVAFGTAPIHRLEDPVAAVNVPMIFYGYQEAVMAIGYSDDWTRFTLAEMLYSQFMVHNISPLVCVNIWNPLENAEDAAAVELQVLKGAVEIDDAMAMISTVSVLKAGDGAYVRGTDYSLAYDGDKLVITVLGGGKIPADVAALTVTYKKAVIDGIEAADIIGGIDPGTKKRSGIELADEVFLRFQKNPGFLLAPGWSDEPGVAAALMSKAKSLNNGNFSCVALLDFPTDDRINNYSAVPEWKNGNGYNSPYAFGDWPCVAIDGRVFRASTRLAGLHGEIDARNGGLPFVSASNKALTMTKTCRADGTELPMLDQGQANMLNENGIGTFLNWGGWRPWGNETLAFPGVTDVKDAERAIRRMFCYVQNTVNRTLWQKVDASINRILIDGVLLTVNQYFNSLVARGAILGGRCEFLNADNNRGSLAGGRVYFRIYITPPGAAKDITFDFQYDPAYLDMLFTA